MNKNNKFLYVLLFLFVSIFTLVACTNTNDDSKVLNRVLESCYITYAEGEDANNVSSNVTFHFTTEGDVVVKWLSSNAKVVSPNGVVMRLEQDAQVTIRVEVILGTDSLTKTFTLIVKGTGGGSQGGEE